MNGEKPIPLEGIRPGELFLASCNYIEALNLPSNGSVLFVIDKLKLDSDPDTNARGWMASQASRLVKMDGRKVGVIAFDDTTTDQDMYEATSTALKTLNPVASLTTPITVAYLGKAWENRSNFYNAVAAFDTTTSTKTRLAISVGLNRADIRTFLDIKKDKRALIAVQIEKMLQFFQEHPRGNFEITTRHGENSYTLNLKYDTLESAFHPDWGELRDNHPTSMVREGYGTISNVANIPGGEIFATPFPFSFTEGQFLARGVLFTVKNGLVMGAKQLSENPVEDIDVSIIMQTISDHPIPVAELGLGLFVLAGIKSEPGSTVLAAEKDGPHIGVGKVPGESSETFRIEELAGHFHHGDLVLDDPTIYFKELEGNEPIQFYPPEV